MTSDKARSALYAYATVAFREEGVPPLVHDHVARMLDDYRDEARVDLQAEVDRLRAELVAAQAAGYREAASDAALVVTHDADASTETLLTFLRAGAEGREKFAANVAAAPIGGHSCGNCEGIDPDTCLANPDRATTSTSKES